MAYDSRYPNAQAAPEFVRDADTLRRAKSHARFVTGREGQRERTAGQNAAIVTTSEMLGGHTGTSAGFYLLMN